MSCIFVSNSYKSDYTIYDNLINILVDNHINKTCCLDYETSLLLEQPIKLLSYSNIEQDEELEEYTKVELSLMVNKLLKERQYIMDLFDKIDTERRKLREDNEKMLEYIFFKGDKTIEKNYEKFFNRSFGLNYEFMRFILEKEKKANEEAKILTQKQLEEINDLNSKINKLEKKLMKSRENLKQYLVTGKINPEEITSLGLTSHNNNTHHDLNTAATTLNDNNQIDFSQDWEKMSLNSHNSNLILFNNKKNPTLTNSASKQVLNPQSQLPPNNKMKLQETKTKIDKYFNKNTTRSPDKKQSLANNSEKNDNAMVSHLKVNHFETGTSNDLKSEKNFSSKQLLTPKINAPKILTHNTETKHLTGNRPSSQSKIHLKKNTVNENAKK